MSYVPWGQVWTQKRANASGAEASKARAKYEELQERVDEVVELLKDNLDSAVLGSIYELAIDILGQTWRSY